MELKAWAFFHKEVKQKIDNSLLTLIFNAKNVSINYLFGRLDHWFVSKYTINNSFPFPNEECQNNLFSQKPVIFEAYIWSENFLMLLGHKHPSHMSCKNESL